MLYSWDDKFWKVEVIWYLLIAIILIMMAVAC